VLIMDASSTRSSSPGPVETGLRAPRWPGRWPRNWAPLHDSATPPVRVLRAGWDVVMPMTGLRPTRPRLVRARQARGFPIQDISDAAGHKSTHVTETVYLHVIRSTIRGGATIMDNVFRDPDDEAKN
jgi:hypothetical protein